MSAKQPDLELTAPGLHLAPSPTVHSDKDDSLLCSFVALKIIKRYFVLCHIGRIINSNGSDENISSTIF